MRPGNAEIQGRGSDEAAQAEGSYNRAESREAR